MKTVLYYDWIRNRKKLFSHLLVPVMVLIAMFVLAEVVDRRFPSFNITYMKWPDVMKDLFGLPGWNSHLAVNVWQIFSLIYPFYLVYAVMTGLCRSVIQEERLETIVYLKNIGVTYSVFFVAKTILWIGVSLLSTGSLLGVTVFLMKLVGAERNIAFAVSYYLGLFVICVFYLSIAWFLSAYRKHEASCGDTAVSLLLLPWLASRIPAVLRLFSLLMEMTGREGKVADTLGMYGERFRPVELVAPVLWCQISVDVSRIYILCAVMIFIIMGTSALSALKGKNNSHK